MPQNHNLKDTEGHNEQDLQNIIGDTFQKTTKYKRHSLSGHELNWSTQPEQYKSYVDADIVKLPNPVKKATIKINKNFIDILKERKSRRFFSETPLTLEQLSFLLWASTGISRTEGGYEYRTAPSAGALYPIETYIVVNNVIDCKQGVYHYNIENHYLEQVKEGNFGLAIAKAALNQKMCLECNVTFAFSAIFQRSKWKYEQRAYRYIYLDAGHIAENLALASTALDLAHCHIGAIYDDEVNEILNIDGVEESAIYLTVIGNM
ncbi:MAG: SagB/ThcOx family dehydrogenase [Candidatus Lokiarchaeota archaeon]|nr:SagB/ThcOx family dehydrogenase [Candidatus Lokiarchaeota archaeon]